MTREEILERARRAQEQVVRAAAAVAEFVAELGDDSPDATFGAARAHQEAISHLNDALSLLNHLARRPSAAWELREEGGASAGAFPRCLRCDKPVERLATSPKTGNPDVVVVEYECHGEVVSQELSAAAARGGLSRYTAFNAFTSGLMPVRPEEQS